MKSSQQRLIRNINQKAFWRIDPFEYVFYGFEYLPNASISEAGGYEADNLPIFRIIIIVEVLEGIRMDKLPPIVGIVEIAQVILVCLGGRQFSILPVDLLGT